MMSWQQLLTICWKVSVFNSKCIASFNCICFQLYRWRGPTGLSKEGNPGGRGLSFSFHVPIRRRESSTTDFQVEDRLAKNRMNKLKYLRIFFYRGNGGPRGWQHINDLVYDAFDWLIRCYYIFKFQRRWTESDD